MKDKIFSFIENSEVLAVELESELCKYPAISPDSDGEGELDKCVFLEKWLKEHGITQLQRYDAPDKRAKGGVRPNLIATINGSDSDSSKGRLWIMSHIDVVPPGEMSLWKTDPWKLKYEIKYTETGEPSGGKNLGKHIIGRGVEDNQQGLTSSVIAALAFVKQGHVPARTVKLLFAADEENGSIYGVDWLIKNHGELFQKNDLVLVPDSGDSKGSLIEIAEKNMLWIKFTVKGKQVHASTPAHGINAYLAGADFTVRLYNRLSEKFSERDPLFDPDNSTFEPTKKEPNVPNINTVPGEDVFYYDMRVLPRHPLDDVLKEVDLVKAEIEKAHGAKVEYTIIQRNESPPTPADSPLVKLLSKNVEEVYGCKTRNIGIGGGTFAAFFRNAGIDSAVWARLTHTAHQPNEYAMLEHILGDAKVMALMMMS